MKLSIKQLLLLLLLVFTYPHSAFGENLPPVLLKSLQSREQNLQHTTFTWTVRENRKYLPSDPNAVAADLRQTAIQARLRARQKGITNSQSIQTFVDKEVAITQQLEQGYNFSFIDAWKFVCNGDATYVTGHNQFSPSSLVKYSQYYDDKQGFLAQYAGKTSTDDTFPNLVTAWSCSENCIQQTYPFPASLGLSPSDFSILLGKDPTKIYSAVWSLVSDNSQRLQMKSEIGKGSRHPFTIKITLDKSHGYAPSYAEVQSGYWQMKCVVTKFRLYQGTWISTNASISEKWLQDLTQTRDWKLQQVTPSKSIMLNFSKTSEILDYRLLNKNPLPGDIVQANQKQDARVVQYYWPGHFPSDQELKQMYQKQNPGEATPDPSPAVSSMLPFAGGLMCLVGGVWMFKRRGVS